LRIVYKVERFSLPRSTFLNLSTEAQLALARTNDPHLTERDDVSKQPKRGKQMECSTQKEESISGSSVWMRPVTDGQQAKQRAVWRAVL
jgi:hypothetical protein